MTDLEWVILEIARQFLTGSELRIHYGPGIRIYYGKIANTVILLLCGGDKGSQSSDIAKAKEYLKDYKKRRENHGKK